MNSSALADASGVFYPDVQVERNGEIVGTLLEYPEQIGSVIVWKFMSPQVSGTYRCMLAMPASSFCKINGTYSEPKPFPDIKQNNSAGQHTTTVVAVLTSCLVTLLAISVAVLLFCRMRRKENTVGNEMQTSESNTNNGVTLTPVTLVLTGT